MWNIKHFSSFLKGFNCQKWSQSTPLNITRLLLIVCRSSYLAFLLFVINFIPQIRVSSSGRERVTAESNMLLDSQAFPANIRLDEDVLKTSWRRLSSSSSEDVLIKTNMFALALRLQKTSWRRLGQDQHIRLGHMSSRRLQDVSKTSSRRLQDAFKTTSRRLQGFFKTSWSRFTKLEKSAVIWGKNTLIVVIYG